MEKERTPSWMRRLVRNRMAETGEKYTQALRAVKAEHERRRQEVTDGAAPSSEGGGG